MLKGLTAGGNYVLTFDSNQVLLYRDVADESWSMFENDPHMGYTDTVTAACGDYLLLPAAYKNIYHCYALADRAWLHTLEIDENAGQAILGFTADGQRIAIADPENAQLLLADARTGERTGVELPAEPAEGCSHAEVMEDSLFLRGNTLGYTTQSFNADVTTLEDGSTTVSISGDYVFSLCLLELDTMQQQVLPLMTTQNGQIPTFTVTPDPSGDNVLLHEKSYDESYNSVFQTTMLSLTTDTRTPIEDVLSPGTGNSPLHVWSPDGRYLAIHCAYGIRIVTRTGSAFFTIDCDGHKPVSLCFTEDLQRLLVLYDDASLCSYLVSGALMDRTEISFYHGGVSAYNEVRWQFTPNGLMLSVDDILNVIDMTQFEAYSYVPCCLHYDQARDSFLVRLEDSGSYCLGWYARYTTAQLRGMAYEILGENTLSPEQRDRYGLN